MADPETEIAGDGEDEGIRIVCCFLCEGEGTVEEKFGRCWLCGGTGSVEIEVAPVTLEDLEDFGEGS